MQGPSPVSDWISSSRRGRSLLEAGEVILRFSTKEIPANSQAVRVSTASRTISSSVDCRPSFAARLRATAPSTSATCTTSSAERATGREDRRRDVRRRDLDGVVTERARSRELGNRLNGSFSGSAWEGAGSGLAGVGRQR